MVPITVILFPTAALNKQLPVHKASTYQQIALYQCSESSLLSVIIKEVWQKFFKWLHYLFRYTCM